VLSVELLHFFVLYLLIALLATLAHIFAVALFFQPFAFFLLAVQLDLLLGVLLLTKILPEH
jgi:hypothetical protein